LIGDVLDVSQMITGRMRFAATTYDMRELIDECVADAHAAYGEHSIVAETAPIALTGDRDRLKQVITNLLSNACRYSPAGSTVRVAARSSGDGDRVLVEVADEGAGIAAEDLERVFERFVRVHRAELPTVKGTGLGLYIAKQIVDAHGGTISVRSAPGEGSTFTVELPRAATFM
jgi:signal transduction histidine kinase